MAVDVEMDELHGVWRLEFGNLSDILRKLVFGKWKIVWRLENRKNQFPISLFYTILYFRRAIFLNKLTNSQIPDNLFIF